MPSKVWDEITCPFPNFNWSLGMDKWFHPTLYNGCNYSSMLRWLKLIHVRGGHITLKPKGCHDVYIVFTGSEVCHYGSLWCLQWQQLATSIAIIVVYYTPAQRSCWGVYWFHSIRLSVRPSICPSRILGPPCSTYSSGWIHFNISTSYEATSEGVSCVKFLQNFKIAIFGNF